MVLLKFPQAKSYLTASAEMFGHAKVYFQELKMATSSMSNSPLNSSSNIIWVVQREFSHFGRDADWNMTFFLRHFNTGYYLSFDSANDSLFMSKDRKHALNVRLERTTNKNKQDIIQDNTTLYIGNGNGYVCMSQDNSSQVAFDSNGEAIHEASFILDALKDSEVKDMEYCLMISRRLGEMAQGFATKTNTDIEDWSKVSADVAGGDLRNLLSLCVDYCIRLVCFLTNDSAVHETITNRYPDFERRAQACMTYISQTTAASDARQVLMREQGLFYHCFSILISVGNGLVKIAGHKKHIRHSNDLRCIGFLLYSTIQLGCKNHRENESYVAKLEVTDALISTKKKNTLDIMIEHLDLDIGAPQTLSALIDDNKELLEKEIHEDRLDEFCNVIADRGLRPVYLNIFAAVCGYAGKSLPKKQIAVSRKLFAGSAYSSSNIFFNTVVLNESLVLEPFPEMLETYGGVKAALFRPLFVDARSHDGRQLDAVPNVKGWHNIKHEVPANPGIKFMVPMNIVNLPTDASIPNGKVNMRTYWQAAEERENPDPVALNLCDNEGSGAYELYVVGHKLDTAFLSASMPSFQELYTWYELDEVPHFVYPCELEEGSPGCARFLSEFKVPKVGDEVIYLDHSDEDAKPMKKKITAVHRAWIKCKTSNSKTSVTQAAVPLRLLQHLGTKSPRMQKSSSKYGFESDYADPHRPPDRVTQYMQQYYEYYLAQLHLFREITYNRNYFGIEKIQQMFSFEEVLSGMNMVHQPEVRRHFCDLMMSVYVDSKDQQALKIPFNARPWQVLDESDVLPSCHDDAQFAMLQAFVEQYLEEKNPGWDNKHSTELTISVLQLCDLLFNFGFYSSTKEIGKVNISLLKGMNPKTDKISLKSSNHRSKYQDMSAHSYHDENTESGLAEVNGLATEKSLQSVLLEFIDGVPYAVFILIPTFVSTLVAITQLIFAMDDDTIDNVIRFENNWFVFLFTPRNCETVLITLLCIAVVVFLFCALSVSGFCVYE